MAKNAKSKGQVSGRPMTEYFTRKRPQPSGFLSDTSVQSSSNPPTNGRPSCGSPSTSSQASNRKRKAAGLLDKDIDTESSQRVNRSTLTRPSNANAAPLTPLSPRENLLHHSASTRFNNHKKQRLSSPDSVTIDEIVPGSESDEVEIPARRISSALITVPDGSTTTEQEFEDQDLVPMDVDDRSPLFTPQSTSYSLFGTDPDTSYSFDSPSVQPLTPPSSSPEPERTASALDSEAKTRQLIEEIRAKARAKVLSSPEPIAGLRSLGDSDDDDDLPDLPVLVGSSIPTSTGKEKEKEIPSDTMAAGPSKYNLRQPAEKLSSKEVVPLTRPKRSKPGAVNPLLALLKEKNKADRAGKGTEALTRAERAVAGKRGLRDEIDGEEDADDEMEDWMGDEKKARQAVQERDCCGWDDDCGGLNGDIDLDENDAKQLFQEDTERGEAVAAILISEKRNREYDHRSMKRVGHPLWTVEPKDAMNLDSSSDFKVDDSVRALQSFKAALQEQSNKFFLAWILYTDLTTTLDPLLACLTLRSGALNRLDFTVNPDVTRCICDLALTPGHTDLNQTAFYFLRNCWSDVLSSKPFFPLQSMVNILARLGANVGLFGWVSSISPIHVTKEERENTLLRLVQFCTLAGSSEKIQSNDAPEVLVALCAISLDPTTSPELRTDISLAAHAVCSALGVGSTIVFIGYQEAKVCSKLLQLISTLTPINRAHAVSIFAGGDGRTLRIARWVSHHLILERTAVSESEYCDLPPLEPLLLRLAPHGSTAHLFEVHQETDYDNLGFYTEILSTVLSDIPRYIAEEFRAAASAKAARLNSESSPSKIQKTTPPIQSARECVELLHSSISDTRGAHLDRSRAKAVLKNLSMRLHYQRVAAIRTSGAKPKNIKQYFSKKT
ncbi:hypothetical protein L218DRAFT_999587 [Marasmius fiardii PR-910]|nr:hypothetical protein L218DRAFT_999587 [Marasmius fiardii PR-910]